MSNRPAAVSVAIGFYYRISAFLLFILQTYIFFTEAAEYNNHYYLMCLLAFLLMVMPGDQRFSWDAWRKNKGPHIPFWSVFLLRFQLFIMYFVGGLAKINADWLSGLPLLAIGQDEHAFLTQTLKLPDLVSVNQLCLILTWGGLFFDLIIGFLLLWKPTRLLGLLGVFLFHLHNQFAFPIGVFPFMAFSATLIFFDPDWPVQLWNRCKRFNMFRRPKAQYG